MSDNPTYDKSSGVIQSVSAFFLILFSIFLLMVGVGLQNTLLGLRSSLDGFLEFEIGVIMAAYFMGFIAGSLWCPALILRVGHVRIFAVLATTLSISSLLHAMAVDPISWTIFRLATGFCVAGLYLVVESWLNGRTGNEERGSVLSAYFFVNLGGVAIGQQFLQFADPRSFELFMIASLLVSMAILPVGVTLTEAPSPTRTSSFKIRSLFGVSPFALVGAACAGIANGAFWGLAPSYGVLVGAAPAEIATTLTVTILGGAALQLPLGRLSDLFDRRSVMAAANAALAVVCLMIAASEPEIGVVGLTIAFLFGGLLLTQYSLCVAHANDHVDDGDYVQMASALLLVFGFSAALGPLLGAVAMQGFGPGALFIVVAAASAVSAAYAVWRMSRRAAPETDAESGFVPMPAALSPSLLPLNEAALEGIDEAAGFASASVDEPEADARGASTS